MNKKEKISNYSRYRGVIEVKPDLVGQASTAPDRSIEASTGDQPAANDRGNLYGAWHELISTTGPYSHLWTLSFIHPYSDRVAINALWDCTRHINRDLWGPRWQKKANGIHATVVAERHKLSHELRGRLHFHVLVQQQDPGHSNDALAAAARNATLWLRDEGGRQMSAPERVDTRPVHDPDGLASYLTKDLQTPCWPKGENIFFVRPSGIEGVVFTLKNEMLLRSCH